MTPDPNPTDPDRRLAAAFGKCDLINATLKLQISRIRFMGGDWVRVKWDRLTGFVTDTYDFAYVADARPRRAAIVQSGFATLAPPGLDVGKVFLTRVVLDYAPPPGHFVEHPLP